MIQYNITPEEITIKGHAGHGKAGTDIVCAGVSCLVETVSDALEELCPGTQSESGSGYYHILLPGKYPEEEIIRAVFEIGMGKIAATYPECVEKI